MSNLSIAEVTYLTNACGEPTGFANFQSSAADKIAFEEGPGCVLPYLVKIKGKHYAMGNLEVAYQDEFWGDDTRYFATKDDARAYGEAMMADIGTRIEPSMHLMELDEDMPGRFIVNVAGPLSTVKNSTETQAALQRVLGRFVDLPDLCDTVAI